VPHFSDSRSCWLLAVARELVVLAYVSAMGLTHEDHYMAQLVVEYTGDHRLDLLAQLDQFALESVPFLDVQGARFSLFLLALAPSVLVYLPHAWLFPEEHEFLYRHMQPVFHMAQQDGVWSPPTGEAVR
jgi:hypothetical protein